jgi:pantetheine-phosphate adenylyltransferase
MSSAVYPATFDPITNGHIDIATRASAIFERVIVAVYSRPSKNLLFSAEERLEMTRQAVAHLANVTVMGYRGMTVEFARANGCAVIVRGLRVLSDFEWEFQLALTNRKLAPDIDTVCLMTSQETSFLSSSVVKEIGLLGGDLSGMAPPHVIEALNQRFQSLGDDGDGKLKIVSVRD